MSGNCYVYTRVSTAVQVDGFSLEAQLEALKEYAKYRDLAIVGQYCDAGKSGKSIEGRPEFQRLMDDVMSNKDKVSFVLVFKLSRFGRNTADVLKSIQLLNDFGVDLVSVNEAIDSSTHGGKLTLAILSAVAEMERENIKVQFMAGRYQKAKSGAWNGGPVPYGYRNVDHKLELDAYEAEVVKKIFDLYLAENGSMASVADALNKSDYKCSDVKGDFRPFTYDFVSRILDNPLYCGRVSFGKTKKVGGKDVPQDPSKVISVKGSHEAIVSEEVWDKAQEKKNFIANEYKTLVRAPYPHLLKGLVKCPVCGKSLVGIRCSGKRGRNGEIYKPISYYQCRYSQKQEGYVCSFTKRVNQEIFDTLVLDLLNKLQYSKKFKNALEKAMNFLGEGEDLTQKLQNLHRSLRDTEALKEKLCLQIDGLNMLNETFETKYQKLSDELDTVYNQIEDQEREIEDTRNALEAVKQRQVSFEKLSQFLKDLKPLLNKMTTAEKKELCLSFIERVDLFPNERQDGKLIKSIAFKFPLSFNDEELYKAEASGEVFFYVLNCEPLKLAIPDNGTLALEVLEDGSKKIIVKKPTYSAIRKYIKEKYGTSISTLYVAQMKRKYGVEIGISYNKPKTSRAKVPNCTPQKEKLILEAFKHFDLVNQTTKFIGGNR